MMQWLDDSRGSVGVAENFERVIRAEIGGSEGVDELRKALESSWARVKRYQCSLGYNMFGRLESEKSKCASVSHFLQSIERFECSLWLQPTRPYHVVVDSRQEIYYELGDEGSTFWISEDFSTVDL